MRAALVATVELFNTVCNSPQSRPARWQRRLSAFVAYGPGAPFRERAGNFAADSRHGAWAWDRV